MDPESVCGSGYAAFSNTWSFMIKAYSQRLLPPYSGQVQIAESDRARALTLDGKNWEIQFLHVINDGQRREQKRYDHVIRHSYIHVANIKNSEIEHLPLPSFVDTVEIDEKIIELSDFLTDISLPFPAADRYEYWLLDDKKESPLALIFSCREAEQMASYPTRPEWTALPASMMNIQATPEEEARAEAPVNYRLERLVAERAGRHPHAAWFKRRPSETDTFPCCLVSEEWEDEAHHQLCQRYIQRQAPRLLMLHQLKHADRLRLEVAARAQAFEVERFYPLYPEVVDHKLMAAIRVEAQLRRVAQNAPS